MSTPSDMPFHVLASRLERIDVGHEVTARREFGGSVRVNAADTYFLRSEDAMDSFLNDMDDLDFDLAPDQIFDSMVELLDAQSD